MTREALELVGDCIHYGWSPSPSQDEEAWFGDSDEGGQGSADGPAESGPQSSRVGTVPPGSFQKSLRVHCGGTRPPQAELSKDVDEGGGSAVGAPGDQVCHFAGETGMPPTYLSIGDDGGAEPVAQVHVHEVVECARVAGLTFGAAAQLTSLSTVTGPSTKGLSTSLGESSPRRKGLSGR